MKLENKVSWRQNKVSRGTLEYIGTLNDKEAFKAKIKPKFSNPEEGYGTVVCLITNEEVKLENGVRASGFMDIKALKKMIRDYSDIYREKIIGALM